MSKRPEYQFAPDTSGRHYWRSLKEYEGDAKLVQLKPAEFAPGITDPPDDMSRRTFFNLMGAASAMAGLAACRRPEEKIVPFATAPEHSIPGKPETYATTLVFAGTAVGVLVESHDGRPTLLNGNPQHPESQGGGLAPWLQASILDLYDPDRSVSPRERTASGLADRSWTQVQEALGRLGQTLRGNGGATFAVLTEGHRSPTLAAQLAALKTALPQARIVRWEPHSKQASIDGARLAFGKPLDSTLDLGKARVLVTLDSDLFHADGSATKHSAAYCAERKPGVDMSRHYAIESAQSISGASADHRLRLSSRDVGAFTYLLAHELAGAGVANLAEVGQAGLDRAGGLSERAKKWAKVIAADLVSRKGASLVVVGPKQPAAVHAVGHAINVALANRGTTITYVKPFDESGEGPAAVVALAQAIDAGQVNTVLVLGGNPVFTAPADANLDVALGKAGVTTIHLSSHHDETSELATWHLNRSHALEAWGDAVTDGGVASIVQPLISPLFDSRSEVEVVSMLLGANERGYDLVRATWAGLIADEKAWRKALHDGVIGGAAGYPYAGEIAELTPAGIIAQAKAQAPAAGGLEITFIPDPHAWDGRFANNPWLQEWPDPLLKHTWGNHAAISPATARKLGLSDGMTISLQLGDEGASARVPVIVSPGHADDSIQLSVGQGRKQAGRVGNGVGSDLYGLRTSTGLGLAGNVKLTKLGGDANLARTQEHFLLEGRPHIRETSLVEFEKNPNFVHTPKYEVHKQEDLKSLWTEPKMDIVHKWGMAIDLNKCSGCGACQVACQAENNIPVVGAEGVRKSREMNWLRVDRYYVGTPDEARTVAQPLPCQQCENAPCEQVCPVAATTHSPEGLNDMAYNRCVGTRYCANNCPFKVRKYNFLNYTKHTPTLKQMQWNPDVTVRSRGVMEKCTFCVQRINEAKIAYKNQGTDVIPDGAIVTACQQSCSSGAIVFGDLNDAKSKVSQMFADSRSYFLLEELNIRPRVTYLARILNENPDLVENA